MKSTFVHETPACGATSRLSQIDELHSEQRSGKAGIQEAEAERLAATSSYNFLLAGLVFFLRVISRTASVLMVDFLNACVWQRRLPFAAMQNGTEKVYW